MGLDVGHVAHDPGALGNRDAVGKRCILSGLHHHLIAGFGVLAVDLLDEFSGNGAKLGIVDLWIARSIGNGDCG